MKIYAWSTHRFSSWNNIKLSCIIVECVCRQLKKFQIHPAVYNSPHITLSVALTRFPRRRLITLVDWKVRSAQSVRITIRLCWAPFVRPEGNYVSDVIGNPTREAYLVRMMLPDRRATGREGRYKLYIDHHKAFYWRRSLRQSRQILISILIQDNDRPRFNRYISPIYCYNVGQLLAICFISFLSSFHISHEFGSIRPYAFEKKKKEKMKNTIQSLLQQFGKFSLLYEKITRLIPRDSRERRREGRSVTISATCNTRAVMRVRR